MGLLGPLCATLMVSLDYLVRGEKAKGVAEAASTYDAGWSPEMTQLVARTRTWSPERLRALLVVLDG